ncbi:NeuD/PglB/VioB family sugar acetyltransferase [Actinokineospora spheciospongiae]|uniref:NeuD/PglB/VioB family sugar acetyltransferase n=1 Tax=Actinokineospora spheciospongiae TaxID=909613 RepID=UPI000D712435|nr:NeuD/PglB/VioB family sugar acetyltransferase [Actinokineospora spheciospongiae]PWW64086.1 sugar O-acyltransferase (sialic acid O-acetyltransferase NeuD family) [Actinokineospora spheciospongiae]
MTARPLLLLGGGGLAREVLAALRALPERFTPLGVLDDDPAKHGADLDGVAVLGGAELVAEHPDALAVACVASVHRPGARAALVERVGLPDERWATVVHPAASVAPGTDLGAGTVLLAGAVITAPVPVGRHVVAMPHVLVTHDCVIGDFATFAGRASLGGGVTVGRDAYLGQGALVREGRTIGERAVVGMGSIVLDDVPTGQTWVGNPARRLR